MTNAAPPEATRPAISAVLWNISWPMFLFSSVLCVLLAASWIFLLPRYVRVDVNGVARGAEELRRWKMDLTAQIAQKESLRKSLVVAIHDPQYEWLKTKRRTQRSLQPLRDALREHAKTATERENAVHLASFDLKDEERTLRILGDIRNVGPSSMTALATYAQSLATLPLVANVSQPAFVRRDDPQIGLHSPFDITLTLR